ncbi:hypothetical protein PVAND_009216 [Polypedilum vanderplanki]|uniref:Uncharacterized protein n=1 Tax=Polypedilum vanderplanki TaxID=319348 RepID=A0A9J6CCL3_POLVA|nr:hypothetical protein PVAND_009216 [Polypedilum vanderplanki]
MNSNSKDEIKLVIVGDGCVGKSYLLITYITNFYPNFYSATSFDILRTNVEHNGKSVKLTIYDTGGCEEYDRLRPLCYKEVDIVIMCFSIDKPHTLENIKTKWLPEIRHYCSDIPIVLVGCKLDLRNNQWTIQSLKTERCSPPSTFNEGRAMSFEIGAIRYFECSALDRTNLTELFDEIIFIVQNPKKPNQNKVCPCNIL